MKPFNNLENRTLSDIFQKSSASMYKSSGSQFFKNTTAIQSGHDTFDKSKFPMSFLTFLGVMEICNFRLVEEWKTGKESHQD